MLPGTAPRALKAVYSRREKLVSWKLIPSSVFSTRLRSRSAPFFIVTRATFFSKSTSAVATFASPARVSRTLFAQDCAHFIPPMPAMNTASARGSRHSNAVTS